MDKEKTLANLLNDESFLRWLENDAIENEEMKWNRWASANPENRELIGRAKKIVSMPFSEWDDSAEMDQDLDRLQHALQENKNLKIFKQDS